MPTQNTIDLYRRFRPTASQAKFIRSTAFGRLFSSGYGSGKSKTGCREGIKWAVKYPGSRGLIGRLTATDLRDTTMVTFWKEMAQIGFQVGSQEQVKAGKAHYWHNKADREITFWNGAVIIYRHLDDPDALGSLELNWAFIDEGAEVADAIYQTIASSRLRWHLPSCDQQERVEAMIAADASDEQIASVACDCPRGIWVCTNPGASGYLKAVTRGEVDGWEWIPAKPGDNVYNGPDYYAKMERDRKINGEVWMRRFYEGSWDAFEGQRFTSLDENVHIMRDPFRITDRHEVVCGWDFGHVETFIALIAFVPDQSEPTVIFDEVVVNEVDEPAQVAAALDAKFSEWGLDKRRVIHMGDPAGVGASQFSSISPIAAYSAFGYFIAPCKQGKNPVDRANLLASFFNQRVKMPDGSEWPKLMFGKAAKRAWESVINLRWKPQTDSSRDPREVFVDKNKHGFDGVSYGIYAVPPPEDSTPKPFVLPAGVNGTARDALARMG